MTTEPAGKVWERLYPDMRKWEQLDESTKEEWRRFYLIALEVADETTSASFAKPHSRCE